MADISQITIGSTTYEIKDSTAREAISGLAEDNAVVHIAGTENITGAKTFKSPVIIETNSDEGFNLVSPTSGGYLYVTRGSGASAVQMAIKSGINGGTFGTNTNHQFQFRTNNVARMTLGIDGSVVIAKDVAANSNNNQVATTKWTNAKLSALATVATSGSYNDLSNKPTIPTVPTKLSEFTDDLGSSPIHTHSQYLTSAPVTSVNGNTGAITGLQTTSNLVTSVSSSSTNSQYPSAKLFYDTVGDIETLLASI